MSRYDTLTCSAKDEASLPAALLTQAKAHCRVEFDRDDAWIQSYVAQSIAALEDVTGLSLFGATWVWKPGYRPWSCANSCPPEFRIAVPKTPLRSITVERNAVDVTSEFLLVGADNLEEPGRAYLAAETYSAFEDIEATIDAGYIDVADMPAQLLRPILLLTGEAYDHRESVSAGQTYELAGLARSLVSGIWRPCA